MKNNCSFVDGRAVPSIVERVALACCTSGAGEPNTDDLGLEYAGIETIRPGFIKVKGGWRRRSPVIGRWGT